jgi:hypothetical protein
MAARKGAMRIRSIRGEREATIDRLDPRYWKSESGSCSSGLINLDISEKFDGYLLVIAIAEKRSCVVPIAKQRSIAFFVSKEVTVIWN